MNFIHLKVEITDLKNKTKRKKNTLVQEYIRQQI